MRVVVLVGRLNLPSSLSMRAWVSVTKPPPGYSGKSRSNQGPARSAFFGDSLGPSTCIDLSCGSTALSIALAGRVGVLFLVGISPSATFRSMRWLVVDRAGGAFVDGTGQDGGITHFTAKELHCSVFESRPIFG